MCLQGFLNDLEPGFDDCPAPCKFAEDEGETVDLPDFCSRCDVRVQLGFFERETKADLARRFNVEPCAWSFPELYEDVRRLVRLDAALRGRGYPRGCDVLTAVGLDILRRERMRPRRIELWQLKQKARNGGG